MAVVTKAFPSLLALSISVGLCNGVFAGIGSPHGRETNLFAGPAESARATAAAQLDLRSLRRAALHQVDAELRTKKQTLWRRLLAADVTEITALKAAVGDAMHQKNVDAVVAAHHLLKTAQHQYTRDRASPPFLLPAPSNRRRVTAPTKVLKDIATTRERIARAVSTAWAVAWLKAQVTYPQLVVEAVQRQIVAIKAKLKVAMQAGDVHGVVHQAKALRLARAERASQTQAMKAAAAKLAADLSATKKPQSHFLGNGVPGLRVVYILDHEGSMLENFNFLKSHLRSSIEGLGPMQSFAVIVFRKNYQILGPPRLVRATAKNKRLFFEKFRRVAPAGSAKYRFRYFARPFKAAFALKPQIIYFLTSGAFDPRLVKFIDNLNENKAVHVYTYAFVLQDPTSIKNLRMIAHANGGLYQYISRQEAGE